MFVDLTRPVLESTTSSCAISGLYVRSPFFSGVGRGPFSIGAYGFADFMTCFGSFSLAKWRLYTGRPDLTPTLVFETSAPVDVTLTEMAYHRVEKHAIGPVDVEPERTADGWLRYVIDYPSGLDAQVVAFTIVAGDQTVTIRNVSYGVDSADLPAPRDVRINIVTTTFRKERQVTGNIETLRSQLLEVAQWHDHFRLTVVDNGRTLPDSVNDETAGITVIPNGNVGGAGGFAAGMLHAMDAGWATHVLMMDDDVTVCPESFKRTVRLLTYASDEYAEAIIAGAMMSNANYELQQEDLGVIQPERYLQPLKPRLLMDREYDITINEEIMPSRNMVGVYSAWWYSCVPMTKIRANGLPIPLFYRRDDVEYGTRLQEHGTMRFMTLNGICVWHDTFDLRWNQAVEVYLSNRNLLIQQAFTPDPLNDINATVSYLQSLFDNEKHRFGYVAMELLCDAIDDYLRGPEYYEHPVGERLFMGEAAKAERLRPLSELEGAPDHVNMRVVEDAANDRNVPFEPPVEAPVAAVGAAAPVSLPRRAVRKLRRVALRLAGRPIAPTVAPVPAPVSEPLDDALGIIPIDGLCTPWRVMHRKRRILAVNPAGTMGVIRERDDARAAELTARFDALIAKLRADGADGGVAARYRAARSAMTTPEFWRAYLAEALKESL
ncbi:dTDP-rhamnosyl transferase RfbF [Bifidobacterium ramosum]|uniref:dTDP-rhamnosyl transferase RfbF n=1 Tax=Bifidobacterium ramosum TaxID=1798158 RepID=A0A6L4X1I2_9BIFI|nr:dTDP-rhamnosyl transferase RfbF [Bifidobacterium ramosum]